MKLKNVTLGSEGVHGYIEPLSDDIERIDDIEGQTEVGERLVTGRGHDVVFLPLPRLCFRTQIMTPQSPKLTPMAQA